MRYSLQPIVIKEIVNHLSCPPEGISAEIRMDNLGIDSLGAITILSELEDKLDIEVLYEIFDSPYAIGDILTPLDQIIAQKNPA